MKTTLITALAVAATLFAGTAHADPATPWVDARQKAQKAHIVHGLANGSLTTAEARRLRRGQVRSRRMERRFKADGVVTRRERVRLHRQLNRQNRRIRRLRNN